MIGIIGVYSVGLLLAGGQLQKQGVLGELNTVITHRINVPKNAVSGYFSRPDHLNLDISFKNLKKIEFKRAEALKKGVLLSSNDDYVNAKIRHNNHSHKVKIRLKGDWTDHLEGDKWSFRVKVRGDNTLFGMKVFSLQHPNTREYFNEWIYHKILAEFGILNLQYKFITLSVNGKNLGVFALEEHFEKRFLERQGQKEGPILKLNEDTIWDRNAKLGPGIPYAIPIESINETHVDVFKQGKTLTNASLKKQYLRASGLLDQFLRKSLPTSTVFNIEKTASFMAISDLLGAAHSTAWHNMRFYYNPITSKLEPIGFDANAGKATLILSAAKNELPFWDDETFIKTYVGHLEKMSAPNYVEKLLRALEPGSTKELAMLHKSYPHVGIPVKTYQNNQRQIHTALHPHQPLLAYVNLIPNPTLTPVKQTSIAIANTQLFPIKIKGIYQGKTKIYHVSTTKIQGRILKNPPHFISSRITLVTSLPKFKSSAEYDKWAESLTLKYSLLGAEEKQEQPIIPHERYNRDFLKNDVILTGDMTSEFRKIALIDGSKGKIHIKTGNWTLRSTVVIPEGYRVYMGPGTTITLSENISFISKSPINWVGTKNNPIRITGQNHLNNGIFILNTKEESQLTHVVFDGLSAPEYANWGLTGAVTFFEAPVNIKNCLFKRNNSEDALNIVRSRFSITESKIEDTLSDALDADFSSGEINKLTITNAGNDGIDVSGSTIHIKNIIISTSADKAISAGENSHITGTDILILSSEIGVTSKDLSTVKLENVSIKNTRVGYALYQKKPEFGPAKIKSNLSTHENIDQLYLLQTNSELQINTETLKPNAKDVEALLYGNIYGKKTER
ncbi:MAG: CotH kinase family protein [bacterium]|nr:CotH kinase family protein [bacterium]